jgi:myo-inositol 2-dehydrogenase/D-chiro-inositol 1-dehydrogenase
MASEPSREASWNRREFLGRSAAAASVSLLAAGAAGAEEPKPEGRKIKLGWVGGGGRGLWLAKLFKQHGGYEFAAVADYFQPVADAAGNALDVPADKRFSGLSGYQKVIASGVEAIALEVPPYFFPEQAKAAVDAGLHVYMAKPVAVDVPGCLAIEAAGKLATEKKRCFLVDYQMPTDPVNIEVYNRIRDGGLGKLTWMQTLGYSGGFSDPPKTANIESRLRGLVWVNDIALGGDNVVNYDIHAVDVAVWVAGGRPTAAAGSSRVCRPDPHGDARDVCSVVYEFADGLVYNHAGQALRNNSDGALLCQVYGDTANAQLNYWGKAFLRGGPKHFGGGPVENLYEAGAKRNIATFHDSVLGGRFDNPTVRRSVDGCLTCILGREAAARHTRMTMDELIKENRRLEVDLSGLKT